MAKAPVQTELADEEIEDIDPGSEGQDGADGEDEGAEDAAIDPGAEQEAGTEELVDDEPASRGSNRFQRLANENRELQRRLADLERRPAATQVQQPQEETEEQFRARISMLPPDERFEARHERSERRNQQVLFHLTRQNQDTADKVSFDAKAAVNPRYGRWADRVEAKRLELLQQGQTVPREAILKFLVGEHVLSNQGTKETKQQRAQGQRRVAQQQTRPASGRSDAPNQGRRPANEAEARRRRLEGAEI